MRFVGLRKCNRARMPPCPSTFILPCREWTVAGQSHAACLSQAALAPSSVTPGTWTEGGTLFLRLSFFETIDSFHYPISTDQGDINIMRREAGHADVVEEGYLPVPCEMSSVPPRHRLWHLKVCFGGPCREGLLLCPLCR